MYRYVPKKTVSSYRSKCSPFLIQLSNKLKEELGPSQVVLVGSGGSGLVLRDGNGPFDLDYNLCFHHLPDEWRTHPEKLKAHIRQVWDSLFPDDYSYGKESTSVLTYLVHKDGAVIFHLDLGILMKNSQGWSRLIHDKVENTYRWNLVGNTNKLSSKIDRIHKAKKWNNLRSLYLRKKNQDLHEGKSSSSFETYAEAINDLYNRLT